MLPPSRDLRGLRVGVIHSPATACLCHRTIEAAGQWHGFAVELLDADEAPRWGRGAPALAAVFDTAETYLGSSEWRWWPRAAAERAGWPVVGSRSEIVRLCDHKALARQALAQAGLPVAPGVLVTAPLDPSTLADRVERAGLQWPVVVKPVAEHGSRGLALCRDLPALRESLEEACGAGGALLLIEEFLPGREFQVSRLTSQAHALPVIEITGVEHDVYSRALKAQPTEAVRLLPLAVDPRTTPPVDRALATTLHALAEHASRRLGLGDLTRFDLRLDRDGQPRILEINTKPSLEPTSALEAALTATGGNLEDAIAGALRTLLEPVRE